MTLWNNGGEDAGADRGERRRQSRDHAPECRLHISLSPDATQRITLGGDLLMKDRVHPWSHDRTQPVEAVSMSDRKEEAWWEWDALGHGTLANL